MVLWGNEGGTNTSSRGCMWSPTENRKCFNEFPCVCFVHFFGFSHFGGILGDEGLRLSGYFGQFCSSVIFRVFVLKPSCVGIRKHPRSWHWCGLVCASMSMTPSRRGQAYVLFSSDMIRMSSVNSVSSSRHRRLFALVVALPLVQALRCFLVCLAPGPSRVGS